MLGDKMNEVDKNQKVNDTDVRVHSCSLHDLLHSNKIPLIIDNESKIFGQLVIPEYQRPYVWKEKQINNLLNDIIEHQKSIDDKKPFYYLGSIILHQNGGNLNIIDGQQRITTSLLIKKIVDQNFKSGINYSSSISQKHIKYNLAYLKSVQNGEIFEYQELEKLLSSINFNQINVTVIITKTEDLAYTFFETQNTGGVRLSGSDILKAHHLRALSNAKLVNYQAKRWESIKSNNLERIVQLMTKIRFWDNRKWRQYPFYRDAIGIKSAIIEEYTINTKLNKQDVSYYYSSVMNEDGRKMQMHESQFKQIKQPLANGNNTLDYINEYVVLYETLFGAKYDHRVPDEFYDFIKKVVHGHNGTLLLKELFEVSIIAYVSRFGFFRLYEATLWLYRAIYSMRVSSNRNVREDSVFRFVYINQFIDNIIEVFTPDELFLFLKKFRYKFNPAYIDNGISKRLHVQTLQNYFGSNAIEVIDIYKETPPEFDKDLMLAINSKLNTPTR